jgi:TolB-like protein/DNA-binding winged helix-turn-helix (wHTH) protein
VNQLTVGFRIVEISWKFRRRNADGVRFLVYGGAIQSTGTFAVSVECYRIGSLILNAGTQEVTRDGEPVPLPPLSFNLLLALIRHAPNVVTLRKLEEEVWSGLVVDRGTINKRVLLVRNSLRTAGCTEEYITVVRGTGYRVSAPVERLPDCVECSELPVNGDVAPQQSWLSGERFAIALAMALVVAGAVAYLSYSNSRGSGQELNPRGADFQTGTAPFDAGGPARRSLAVLPFSDQSEGFNDQYLADGVAREITGLLSGLSELNVASSSSAFAFRDSGDSQSTIAAQLNVDALLTGTVHRFGRNIHVVASLVDVPTGYTIWSESYERDLEEVFKLQDDIAFGVATALKVPIQEGERPNSRQGFTGDVQAFTHFLKGRSLMDDRINLGSEGLYKALELFIQAVAIDPYFVRAHVGVASVNFLLPSYDPALDVDEYLQRGEASARYALELDSSSSEALGVLGAIMARRGEPLQAATLFRHARELGNSDPNVLHWHAMHFTSMGYFEELVTVLDDAYRLDPLNPLLGCSLASALSLSGQPQESTRVLNGMIPFSRRDLGLANASLYIGEFDKAREMLRDLELRAGILPAVHADRLVMAFENPGQYTAVEDYFVAAALSGELTEVLAFEVLLIMGSPRAFDLEVDLRGTPFQHSLPEPVWNNWGAGLRRDPRFKEWVRELGYDQYWREYGWPDRCRPTGLSDFECV